MYTERSVDLIRERQSEVSRSGKKWEDYVENFLKSYLHQHEDLSVISLSTSREAERLREENYGLYKALSIEVFHRGEVRELLGDVDIVAYSKSLKYPVAIVSCKLSLHGRLTETLFYAIYYRLVRKIKYVLATPDKGRQSGSGRWESEWGTEENPTKDRLLGSLFLDGVYVENVRDFMPPDFNPEENGTALGGIVKSLKSLPEDIVKWYKELKG